MARLTFSILVGLHALCRRSSVAIKRIVSVGAIPGLCGGASACFALYAGKVLHAADQWSRLEGVTARVHREAQAHTVALRQHGWSCGALALISTVTTVESARDWRAYRGQSIEAIEAFLVLRQPFFVRASVVATAGCSLAAVWMQMGAVRILLPQRPIA